MDIRLSKTEQRQHDSLPEHRREAYLGKIRSANKARQEAKNMVAEVGKQARKDETHQKIIAGGIALQALTMDVPGFADFFRSKVSEGEHYKFPKLWPNARRPESNKKQGVAA